MGTQPPPQVILAAQAAQVTYGIPASVQLAQWALESGWGRHVPGNSNNPFGYKAFPGQASIGVPTKEYQNGEWITINAQFRVFPTLTAAFDAHAALLAQRPQYAPARACLPNVAAFCEEMGPVYATDPGYAHSLLAIIDDSDLTSV